MGWTHGGRRSPEGLNVQEHEWFRDAVCRGMDNKVFFDHDRDVPNERAKFYCRRCPVRTECADYAWNNDIPYGVWGGVTEAERGRGVRYMPEPPPRPESSPTAVEVLQLHRSGMKWRAITRATGVPARTIFKLIQQDRAS